MEDLQLIPSRDGVVATQAAETAIAPADRAARAASAKVAPVVTMSSTTITVAAASTSLPAKAPDTLPALARAESPAWSETVRHTRSPLAAYPPSSCPSLNRSSGVRSRTARSIKVSSGSSPRTRRAWAPEGTGTTTIRPAEGLLAMALDSGETSSSDNGPARSRRPPSL